MAIGAIGILGKQQMIEQTIGFMGGVDSRENPALRMATTNPLIGRGDGWAVVG
jgi:hypothetical protein